MHVYLNAILPGPLSNADNFFIVADAYLSNLYQVDASSGAMAQLLPFGTAYYPLALIYDPDAKLIYWTDGIDHTINRYSFITNSSTVVYRDPSNTGKDISLRLTYVKFVADSRCSRIRRRCSTYNWQVPFLQIELIHY